MSLPLGMQVVLLFDQMPQRMASVAMPPIPRAPKFDGRLSRKGGYCWMSELDLESLRFWHGKKSEPGKPEFAEKDAKTAKELGYWIAWRMGEPQAIWRGERNRQPAQAKAPSREPDVHPWEPRGGSSSAPAAASDSDYFSGGDDSDGSASGGNGNGSSEYGF